MRYFNSVYEIKYLKFCSSNIRLSWEKDIKPTFFPINFSRVNKQVPSSRLTECLWRILVGLPALQTDSFRSMKNLVERNH